VTVEYQALGVFHHAEAYWKAADHLAKKMEEHRIKLRFLAPVHHLYGHAIENVLKAFLLTRGYTEQALARQQWGHNLDALYHESTTKRLPLGRKGWAERKRLISLINSHHSVPYTFRYLKIGLQRVPTNAAFSGLCRALFRAVGPFVGAHRT
jgi:hypothetical protein